mgnify:CR=1 FL=1
MTASQIENFMTAFSSTDPIGWHVVMYIYTVVPHIQINMHTSVEKKGGGGALAYVIFLYP